MNEKVTNAETTGTMPFGKSDIEQVSRNLIAQASKAIPGAAKEDFTVRVHDRVDGKRRLLQVFWKPKRPMVIPLSDETKVEFKGVDFCCYKRRLASEIDGHERLYHTYCGLRGSRLIQKGKAPADWTPGTASLRQDKSLRPKEITFPEILKSVASLFSSEK